MIRNNRAVVFALAIALAVSLIGVPGALAQTSDAENNTTTTNTTATATPTNTTTTTEETEENTTANTSDDESNGLALGKQVSAMAGITAVEIESDYDNFKFGQRLQEANETEKKELVKNRSDKLTEELDSLLSERGPSASPGVRGLIVAEQARELTESVNETLDEAKKLNVSLPDNASEIARQATESAGPPPFAQGPPSDENETDRGMERDEKPENQSDNARGNQSVDDASQNSERTEADEDGSSDSEESSSSNRPEKERDDRGQSQSDRGQGR